MEKKIGKCWFSYGRVYGFALGFTINRLQFHFDLGFWYIGLEF